MAYDASTNDQDQPQIAGAAPLSQGEATPMSSDQSQGDSAYSQSSGSSTIQSSGSTAPKQKASSGMFKNIQKYVEKNQPQAQKIAGAATEDFGKQANAIREATEKKEAQQAQSLQANTQAMSKQKDWAQGQVDQAMGTTQAPAPVEGATAPTAEDNAKKYQELMAGKIGGVNQVQDLNLAQQQMKADALKRLAQGTETEQGRRNLLQETFQDRGQYNRGMSGLDQLIVSGDQGARESIIGGTQDRAKALQDKISGTSKSSREALTEQQRQLDEYGGQISGLGQAGLSSVDQTLEQAYADELASRQGLTSDFEKSSAGLEAWKTAKLAQLGDVEDWKNISGQIAGSGDLGRRGADYFSNQASGGTDSGTGLTSRISEDKFQKAMKDLIGGYGYGDENLAGTYGANDAWKKMWADSKSSNSSSADQYFNKGTIQDVFRNLKSSIEGVDSQQFLKDKFAAENKGQTYGDYIAGAGLDKYDTANQVDIDKLKRLEALMGKTDAYTDEQRNANYSKTSDMSNLLKKYSV